MSWRRKTTLIICLICSAIFSRAQEVLPDTLAHHPIDSCLFPGFQSVLRTRIDSVGKTMQLPYNALVHESILKYDKRRADISKMLGLAPYYFPLFEKALSKYHLPDELKYLPIIESELDPTAISKSGAAGLWQFMPTTGKGYGLKIDSFEDCRHDPVTSSEAAAHYLRDAYNEFGDWLLTLTAYNVGTGTVRRAIAKYGTRDYWALRPFLPKQAQHYVPSFIAALYTMKHACELQIDTRPSPLTGKLDSLLITSRVSLKELAAVLEMPEKLIYTLNPTYTKTSVYADSLSTKKIVIPAFSPAKYAAVFDLINRRDTMAFSLESGHSAQLASNITFPGDRSASVHVVAKGENLKQIAAKYKMSVDQLRTFNNLKTNVLNIGQELRTKGLD